MDSTTLFASGAISRPHYQLVRTLEDAPTPQHRDAAVEREVERIRDKLEHGGNNTRKVMELLVLLMQCHVSAGELEDGTEWALVHAVKLAEGGRDLVERRIGYLFVSLYLPPEHELALMLVNTIRKDLESPLTAHVLLALSFLLHCPSAECVPAIRRKLTDLVSHSSPDIRRKTLGAVASLSRVSPDLFGAPELREAVFLRLSDADPSVASACTTLVSSYLAAGQIARESIVQSVSGLLKRVLGGAFGHEAEYHGQPTPWLQCKVLRLLREALQRGVSTALQDEILSLVLTVYKRASSGVDAAYGILLESLRTLSSYPASVLAPHAPTLLAPLHTVLASHNANKRYLALRCLDALPAELWTLEEREMGRVMEGVEHADQTVRVETLRLLNRLDPALSSQLHAILFASLQSRPSPATALRILEVARVARNGAAYARRLEEAMDVGVAAPADVAAVWEEGVERVLRDLRDGSDEFRTGFGEAMMGPAKVEDEGKRVGPTLAVIYAAVACEYPTVQWGAALAEVLHTLAGFLSASSAGVQEALIVALVRVAGRLPDGETVPDGVTRAVEDVQRKGRRHIRIRCNQFRLLSEDSERMKDALERLKDSTLPDVLRSMEEHFHYHPPPAPSSPGKSEPTLSPTASTSRLAASALRYDAYDAPPPPTTTRRMSRSGSASSSSTALRHGGQDESEPLARTLTPGELALADADFDGFESREGRAREKGKGKEQSSETDDLASRADLINLSSSPPPRASPSQDLWSALPTQKRGWSELAVPDAMRALVILGLEELAEVTAGGMLLQDSAGTVAVRLKDRRTESSEGEGGTLWVLRSVQGEVGQGWVRTVRDALEGA